MDHGIRLGRLMRILGAVVISVLSASLVHAASVKVRVYGPAGNYTAYIYMDGSQTPYKSLTGGWGVVRTYGDFDYSVAAGHAYWSKAVRLADGLTRVGSPSVVVMWPWSSGMATVYLTSTTLNGVTAPVAAPNSLESSAPAPDATGATLKTSWSRVKQLYRK
ncbi:MAG: hypothetical protein ABL977_03450 [Candidatus Eisenbacteria bacterium]